MIDYLKTAAFSAGAERLRLSVDETAYRKGNDYVTVVTEQESGAVLHVAKDRLTSSLGSCYEQLDAYQLNGIEVVCMDMRPVSIKATRDSIEGADHTITFDCFHVAQYLGKGVDQVRRDEHHQLLKAGGQHLKGTKYQWPRNPANMSWHQRRALTSLRNAALKTSRAWAMKDFAAQLWHP